MNQPAYPTHRRRRRRRLRPQFVLTVCVLTAILIGLIILCVKIATQPNEPQVTEPLTTPPQVTEPLITEPEPTTEPTTAPTEPTTTAPTEPLTPMEELELFAEENGGDRRAAAAHHGGKSADGQNDGKGETQTGEGQLAGLRHTADVNAVDDIIEQVDQLGHHGRQRQLEHQRPKGRRCQKFLRLFAIFHEITPLESVR